MVGVRVGESQGDATRVDGLFAWGLGCQGFGGSFVRVTAGEPFFFVES